jgi:hypothetical protein
MFFLKLYENFGPVLCFECLFFAPLYLFVRSEYNCLRCGYTCHPGLLALRVRSVTVSVQNVTVIPSVSEGSHNYISVSLIENQNPLNFRMHPGTAVISL